MARPKTPQDSFRWFDSSPQVIRLVVIMYMKYPLSLPNWEAPSPLDFFSRRGQCLPLGRSGPPLRALVTKCA